jgi:hypothetical protein
MNSIPLNKVQEIDKLIWLEVFILIILVFEEVVSLKVQMVVDFLIFELQEL